MNKPTLFFVLGLIALIGWGAYEAGLNAETEEAPAPAAEAPKPQDSGAKNMSQSPPPSKDVEFGSMVQMSDPLATAALVPLHLQRLMLNLCGITAADAPATFAAHKAEEEKYLSAMSAAAKQALPGEYAKVEGHIRAQWDKATAEERAKGCADIKAQAVAEGAK
jgi:hypothetical protein